MKDSKQDKIIKYTFLLGLFLLVLGVSYSLFTVVLTGKKKTRINTASFKLELLDKDNHNIEKKDDNQYEYEIDIDKAIPEEDSDGLKREGFIFKLKNSGSIPAKYTIYLDDVELEEGKERLLDQYVKYSLTKNSSKSTVSLLSSLTDRKLDKGLIDSGSTNTYELKIWVDYNAPNEAMNKVFDTELRVVGEQFINNTPFEIGTVAFELYNNSPNFKLDSTVSNGFNSEKEEDGLYEFSDKEGTKTYVFRGINPNNYIRFSDLPNVTWKAFRVEPNGKVKLITYPIRFRERYNSYKEMSYNSGKWDDNDSKFQGSAIQAYLNDWYQEEMINYDDKIVTNTYCSDRTEDHNSQLYKYYTQTTGEYTKIYGLWNRINYNGWDAASDLIDEQVNQAKITPSISCREEDKVNTKVALITADEYILAGGAMGRSQNYLQGGWFYWTMSPNGYGKISNGWDHGGPVVHFVSKSAWNGWLSADYSCTSQYAIRPVITIDSNLSVLSGNGTSSNPYIIE